MRYADLSMPRKVSSPRSVSAAASVAFAAVVASIALAPTGCAGPGDRDKAPISTSRGAATEQLRRMAEVQVRSPDTAAMRLPAPKGIDQSQVEELPAEERSPGAAAMLPLEAALARYAELPVVPAMPDTSVDDEAKWDGVREYIAGRLALADGDALRAIELLQGASRLDPNPPETWRELGEAQLAAGRRVGAMASLREAAARGVRETRVYWILGRDAYRSRKFDEAARWLARARSIGGGDAALTYIIDADLAVAMRELGHLKAASELLRLSLELPSQFVEATQYRAEIAELYRRRAELWQLAGDIACRTGDYAAALASYDEATELPTIDPRGAFLRSTHALLRLGRSAEVAQRLLVQISEDRGRVESRQMSVVRLLASTRAAEPFRSGLNELATSLGEDATPSIQRRLLRARAAASSPEQARTLLRAAATLGSPDAEAVEELLAAHGERNAAAQVRELVRLVEAAPEEADRFAQVLLAAGHDLAELDRALRPGGNAASRLLYLHVQDRLGRWKAARDAAADLDGSGRFRAAAALAKVEAYAAAGDWESAEAALRDFPASLSPEAAGALARAKLVLGRPSEALEVLEPALAGLDSDALHLERLLQTVELAVRAERPQLAEQYANRALRADRFDERPYAVALALYSPLGPIPNPARFNETSRALREAIPTGRLQRRLAAQELVQRGLFTQAEGLLLSLYEEDPSNTSQIDLLATVWERLAGIERPGAPQPEAWLRERLAARPGFVPLAAALARVLASLGRADEADALLAPLAAAAPIADLSRLREAILRGAPGRRDEAFGLARKRLEGSPRTPAVGVEFAEFLVEVGEPESAARRLREGFPPESSLSREHTARLLALIARLAQQAPQGDATPSPAQASAMRAAADLLDFAGERAVLLPTQMHELRISLLVRTGAPPESLRAACEYAARQHPTLAVEAYQRVVVLLERAERSLDALRFIEAACTHGPVPNDLYQYWLILAARRGGAADVERFVRSLPDGATARAVYESVFDRLLDDELPEQVVLGEIAYRLAVEILARGDQDEAIRAYRFVLTLDPEHAFAANDLGYSLLEIGHDLDEVERLLTLAYRKLSDVGTVIDSLGWLRYKQGIIDDERGPDGRVLREGAITLLERAVADDGSDASAIYDHLGDAYWVAGRRQDALRAWTRADSLVAERAIFYQQVGATGWLVQENESLRRQVKAKIDAVSRNQQPPIADTPALHNAGGAAAADK